MFADDTNMTVPGCTFAELEQATNSELNNIYSWLKANTLSLNIANTEFILIAGFHMTSLNFKLQNYWSSWDFTFMMCKSS